MTARMRTIKQVMQELHAADPESAVTERGLRRLVNTGEIPCVCVGNKRLLNLDFVLNYFGVERMSSLMKPTTQQSATLTPMSAPASSNKYHVKPL